MNLNFNPEKIRITKQEINTLNLLNDKAEEDSLVLFFPDWFNYSSSVYPAFSGTRAYLAHQNQTELFGVNYNREKEDLLNVFRSTSKTKIKDFLRENKIDYFLLWKKDQDEVSPEFLSSLLLVEETDAGWIYKVN